MYDRGLKVIHLRLHGSPGLHSMVATAPAGVVSLANRVSLQPAHQRL
jgi:hypothetical protein